MSHKQHDLFENRTQFQLERLILFSDAVFAIAITLLIIEIKVPHLQHDSGEHVSLGQWFIQSIPKFVGFVLSFSMIGIYWNIHHRMFGYVKDYDQKLIWLNIFFLMWIVLMPFSSALYSENFGSNACFIVYCINLIMLGVSVMLLWKYIGSPKRNLSMGLENPNFRKYLIMRSLVVNLSFLIGIILCLFDNTVTAWMARYCFILIWPGLMLVKRLNNKNEGKKKRPTAMGR